MNSYFKSPPFYITVVIMAFVSFMYFNFKDKYVTNYDNPQQVIIKEKWNLPKALKEVSGIAYVNDSIMACVQDEEGKIFLYNLKTKSIEKTIVFGDLGDYEGIALVGKSAFVVESTGTLYEVKNFTEENFNVVVYKNPPLSKDHDIEGLCYDKNKNRLLLACKENPDHRGNFKSVYEFHLKTRKLNQNPVFKLTYDNPIFDNFEENKDEKLFRPSEIGIHPTTNDIYMLDGAIPKILILNKNWEAKTLLVLDPDNFYQPEGIAFTPKGDMFISNEGDLDLSNILHVSLKEKVSKNKNKNSTVDEPIENPSSKL